MRGLQLFLYAECGAGTPSKDDFLMSAASAAGGPPLAARPFVSALAKRLLGRPRGASALLAHVDRVWAYSISWKGAGPQIQTFVNALGAVLSGKPIGLAHKHFSARYAELAANLSSKLAAGESESSSPDHELLQLRFATMDARNYVIIGDPAARIPL